METLSQFASWLINQLEAIISGIMTGLAELLSLLLTAFFDLIIGIVNLLPNTHFEMPTAPTGTIWSFCVQSANFFVDIQGMITILATAITVHLSIVVIIAILRFVQVMK